MKRLLLILAMLAAGCTPKKPPVVTPPVQPPATPAQDVAMRLDELVRPAPGAKLTRGGQPWVPTQCLLCCRTFEPAPNFVEVNSGWPLISKAGMDYLASFGCDMFQFRMGPFYASADPSTETEWKDTGGPYLGDGPDFNPAFWEKVYALARNAPGLVEVITTDTWYCKHSASNWGDTRMPWPQADIDACGITMTPVQERFIRKVVQTFRCLGNVVFVTDNEGTEIRGKTRRWFEDSARIIRDEEQQSPCVMEDGSKAPVVHMIGTNVPEYGDGLPFDFVVTHDARPLLAPIHGKWSLNNERADLTPDQEVSFFEQARERGLGWAFWRGGMDNDKFEETLRRYQSIVRGGAAVGCMPAPDGDGEWAGVPGTVSMPSEVAVVVGAALEVAKTEVGDPRPRWPASGTPEERFAALFVTLDQLAAAMRRQGLCAGRMRDSVFVRVPKAGETGPTTWYELHAVAATDGGYTGGNGYRGSAWRYPR